MRNPLCKSMQRLLLGNTLVKVKGAALVLKLLPNIVSLGNFVFTAAGLKRIYGSKLRLKHGRAMRLQHVSNLSGLFYFIPVLSQLYFTTHKYLYPTNETALCENLSQFISCATILFILRYFIEVLPALS